jgi:hypothetical protein
MRRFIALGVGVAMAGTLALGPASPAQAVISPPNSVVTQVCNGLPAQLTSIANAILSSTSALTAAQTNLATKTASFTAAQNNLVAALISYIQAIDLGGSLDAQQAIVGARLVEYSDQAVLWGNAWNALNAAELNAAINGMTQSVLGALNTGLCVPLP